MFKTQAFWDERFKEEDYFYGREANEFLKNNIEVFSLNSKIISLGEGEGRNAVFVASKGHSVTAVDASEEGLKKLSKLAEELGLQIEGKHDDVVESNWDNSNWDGIINIFCHLSSEERKSMYKKIIKSLNIGGVFLTEMFSKNQFGKTSGGPQNLDMLLTVEEFENYFNAFEILYLKEELVQLNEGPKHSGEASVVRFIGKKR